MEQKGKYYIEAVKSQMLEDYPIENFKHWSRWDVIPTGRLRIGEIKRLNKYSRNN